MKNIAIILNTDQLGGAERSLLLQLDNHKNCKFVFFIPQLTKKSKDEVLVKHIEESSLGSVRFYNYPKSIYEISRKKIEIGLHLFTDLIKCLFFKVGFEELNSFDHVYINGNKAALLFFLQNFKLKFSGEVTWHLRDYYSNSKFINFIWKFIDNIPKNHLKIICNSISVKESLTKSYWRNHKTEVIYNPSGTKLKFRNITQVSTIGFVSMMAPWKGMHEVILWASLYKEDLKSLGINKIKFYGDDIYLTKGEHSKYKSEILELCKKLPNDLISFEGFKNPEIIFNEIDCLIHYSLEPEPFGRVIIEAFDAGVPVISTALGGSLELINNNAIKVVPYDLQGLYDAMVLLIKNTNARSQFVIRSKNKSIEIQKEIYEQMERLLVFEEAS